MIEKDSIRGWVGAGIRDHDRKSQVAADYSRIWGNRLSDTQICRRGVGAQGRPQQKNLIARGAEGKPVLAPPHQARGRAEHIGNGGHTYEAQGSRIVGANLPGRSQLREEEYALMERFGSDQCSRAQTKKCVYLQSAGRGKELAGKSVKQSSIVLNVADGR